MYVKRKRYTKAQVASYYAGLRAGKLSAGRSRSRGKPRYKKKRWY